MAVTPAAGVVRFGLFDFDPKAGQLNRKGVRVRLPQQPLQVLRVLVERPGEIVTREELQRLLWSSDVFVDFDHGLNKSIQKLREALGDSADSPRFIETIPRTGYRFIAPVVGETAPPVLAPREETPSATVVEAQGGQRSATRMGSKWTWYALAASTTLVLVIAVGSSKVSVTR